MKITKKNIQKNYWKKLDKQKLFQNGVIWVPKVPNFDFDHLPWFAMKGCFTKKLANCVFFYLKYSEEYAFARILRYIQFYKLNFLKFHVFPTPFWRVFAPKTEFATQNCHF